MGIEIATTLFLEGLGIGLTIAFPDLPRSFGFAIMVAGALPLFWLALKSWRPSFQLSSPLGLVSSLIDLKEAATIAYEETRGTKVGTIAEGLNTNDVLGYYAHALFNGSTTLYGNHPPSRKRETIPNEEVPRCGFSDDLNGLRRHGEDRNLYENLKISRADTRRRIAELKAAATDDKGKIVQPKVLFWATAAAIATITAAGGFAIFYPVAQGCTAKIATINEGRVRAANLENHWALSRNIHLSQISDRLVGVRFEARSKPGADLKAFNIIRPDGKPSPLDSYGQLDPEGIYFYVHKPDLELRLIVVAAKPELVVITHQFRCE